MNHRRTRFERSAEGSFPYWVCLIEEKCTGPNYEKVQEFCRARTVVTIKYVGEPGEERRHNGDPDIRRNLSPVLLPHLTGGRGQPNQRGHSRASRARGELVHDVWGTHAVG